MQPGVPQGLSDQNWKQCCLQLRDLYLTAAKRKKTLSKHGGSLRLDRPSAHLLLVTVAPQLSDSPLTASCLCRSLWRELLLLVWRERRCCCGRWLLVEIQKKKTAAAQTSDLNLTTKISFSAGQTVTLKLWIMQDISVCTCSECFTTVYRTKCSLLTRDSADVSWHKHSEAPFVREQKATGERTTSAHILLCQHKQSQVCASALSAVALQRFGALPAVSSE